MTVAENINILGNYCEKRDVVELTTENLSEAEIFNSYLKYRYSVQADHIETKSTNCGNNITFLLELLEREKIPCRHIILSQDAAMQYRMEMGMRKYRPDINIINFATYRAVVREQNSKSCFCNGESN